MVFLFYSALLGFCIIEIWIAIQLAHRNKATHAKGTAVPAGIFAIFALALFFSRTDVPFLLLLLSAIAILVHTYMGYYLDFYRRSKVFDRYLHGYGTFSFALLLYDALAGWTSPGGSVFFRAVFVAALGIAVGTVYEIYEFAHDAGQKIKMQKGLKDTNFDMLSNLIGAVAAAVLASFTILPGGGYA